MKKIQNRGPKIIGNIFIVLSLAAMACSIRAFSDSHPLHATFLTLDSAILLVAQ